MRHTTNLTQIIRRLTYELEMLVQKKFLRVLLTVDFHAMTIHEDL